MNPLVLLIGGIALAFVAHYRATNSGEIAGAVLVILAVALYFA